MAGATKKAKLAHEKKKGGEAQEGWAGAFTFKSVVELVEWSGVPSAVVDLDGEGTLGIVNRRFVAADPASGELRPAAMACPAVYDDRSRARAVEAHQAWSSSS